MEKEKHSVLVVDDDAINIAILTDILEPEFTVYAEDNGPDAIKTAETRLPDVILLDVVMQGMDGYAVIAELKKNERTRDIPVIFATGRDSTGDEEKGLALGAVDYIAKPYIPTIVKLRVENQITQLVQLYEKELSAEALKNALNKSNETLKNLRDAYAKLKDSTEKVREAEESNKAKSSFLAMISHEIRTPMNSIMGFADLALTQTYEPQTKEYLYKITDSTKWLLHIINDILDISNIDSGKLELEYMPFNLHDIIERCRFAILPSVEKKGLDLQVHAELAPDMKIIGDPTRLHQVLMNLMSNAVKFTNKGTVKLSTSTKKMRNGNTTVHFEIWDNGIGMTSEQVAKVFDPFMQANLTATRKYGGTGLGLAITKNLVELMGGKLTVETAPDEGCIFRFEITFETVNANSDTQNITPELTTDIEKSKTPLDETVNFTSSATNTDEKNKLFDKLESMFENINPECVNLLDEIRAFSGTEELVRQIENYDFDSATRTLAGLRGKEAVNHG